MRRARPLVLLWLAGVLVMSGCGSGRQADSAAAPTGEERELARLREQMVKTQIEDRDVSNPRVLAALRKVPRHRFVPEHLRFQAYEDAPLPIGRGQTISQPYMVAIMTELLEPEPGDRVLEVGTGSGYQAAVLSELVAEVHSIEIVPELAEGARRILAELGRSNVHVITGDGYRGLPDRAPFDGIVVTAAPERVPEPLLEQLAVGGHLVVPVGSWDQELEVWTRNAKGLEKRSLFPVRFVPMRGEVESD
jgi:protein-L-isoaspartate(D-aspartate) O-methyltransferase